MNDTQREYAQALFNLALEENAVEEYDKALEIVKDAVSENPEYIEFLNSPAISLSTRLEALNEAFGKVVPEHVLSFLCLLCENNKSRELLSCINEFSSLAMQHQKSTFAKIYSVVELNKSQKDALCQKLEKLTKKSIVPIYIIDTSLIGGIKIEVDGTTLDSSLKNRLYDIKDVMNA